MMTLRFFLVYALLVILLLPTPKAGAQEIDVVFLGDGNVILGEIKKLEFGNIVNELYELSSNKKIFAPENIRINQWRNIAYHHWHGSSFYGPRSSSFWRSCG